MGGWEKGGKARRNGKTRLRVGGWENEGKPKEKWENSPTGGWVGKGENQENKRKRIYELVGKIEKPGKYKNVSAERWVGW